MSTLLHPAGPENASVYWRRRAAVIGGLILLILIIWMIANAASSDGKKGPSASPGASPTVSTTESHSADPVAEAPPCAASAIKVDLAGVFSIYDPSDDVGFTATVTNTGAVRCTVDPASLSFLVTSGPDRIFSSTDCAADDGAVVPEDLADSMVLDAGAKEDLPFVWNRVRSNEDCAGNLPVPKPGTYHIIATIADVQSNDTIFELR